MFRQRQCAGIAIAILVLAISAAARADQPFSFDATPGKLPKTVVPHHYALRLEPDLQTLKTRGTMRVEIEVRQAVDEIVLNALDIDITSATLRGRHAVVLNPVPDAAQQIVRLHSPSTIPPGKYQLDLVYTGLLKPQAQGLYFATYPTSSGQKMMLVTQMEPADARRMFPGWDEPSFRATYDLTVVVPEKHLPVSNMPIAHEKKLPGGLKEVTFQRTPPMPSYLVVLVSGELEAITDKSRGVNLRVITTEGNQERGRYALESAKKLLDYYYDYFGVKYPLPKLDLIAIPGGFSGAMENWGGITFNESVLLYDPRTSAPQTQRDIFVTVAHEMSHQWFGDLVTMAWWDDLWLNEGFASWMEVKATDHFNPTWEMPLSAALDKDSVMQSDARRTTHPIQDPVTNESDANDAFDAITYQKGGAFIRMLEGYLGAESFRKGIRKYIAGHAYSNTTTADLWLALEQSSGKSITDVAEGWTKQPGLPLVKASSECVNGRQTVTLRQQRFTVDYPEADPLFWLIPIELEQAGRPAAAHNLLLEGLPNAVGFFNYDIVIVNAGGVGYFRTEYDTNFALKIRDQVGDFPAVDQITLLSDDWALVEAGRQPATNYFDLVERLRSATNFATWDGMLTTLEFVDLLERGQPTRARFQEYVCDLLRPQLQRLGWEAQPGETGTAALLRNRIVAALGHFGDPGVIAACRARFGKFVEQPDSLPAGLRACVINVAGRHADQSVYDQLHTLAIAARGTEERQLYYGAMAGALDEKLASRTLELALTDELAPEAATALVGQVATAGEHTQLAWDFTRRHVRELLDKVDSFDRNDYIPSILASATDPALADGLDRYVAKNVSEDAAAKADQVAQEIRFREDFQRRALPEIDGWIAARPPAAK